MKKTIILIYPVGITPLQAIEKFKEKNPKYNKIKMGYAGKLDPMAEGVLLILVGFLFLFFKKLIGFLFIL